MKLVLILIFTASAASAKVVGRVAAVVNDSAITLSDLEALKKNIKKNKFVDENILSRDQLKKISSVNQIL